MIICVAVVAGAPIGMATDAYRYFSPVQQFVICVVFADYQIRINVVVPVVVYVVYLCLGG